eukprot:scaffold5.g711.t1
MAARLALLRRGLSLSRTVASAGALTSQHAALGSVIASQDSSGSSQQEGWWRAAGSALLAAGAAVAAAPAAACEAPQPAPIAADASGGGGAWLPRWLWPGNWFGRRPPAPNPYLDAMADDPRVAVVMCYALPYLSLAFGYVPAYKDMARAAALVAPHLPEMAPWEVAVLLWGAARLGWQPTAEQAVALQARAAQLAARPPGVPGALTAQEAAMLAWGMAVEQLLTPELWAVLVGCVVRSGPAASMDEVTCVHLYQASWAGARACGPSGPQLPRMRSAADEVRATLAAGGCPLPLIERCERTYKEAASQPGFDGPLIVELTLLRTLVSIWKETAEDPAYRDAFHDLKLVDQQRAQQLLEDPYLLAKFKSEIADRRARANEFIRQLQDVSRTLRELGLYHVTQAPVEDGLVHVDIALPDYKIALFLETSAPAIASGAGGDRVPGAPGLGLGGADALGTALSGYAANETPGTKRAKLRLLEQLGWKVLPLRWIESSRGGDAAKRQLLLHQLEAAGREQLMRGRVSSMLHGAMRGAEESKLGRERYGGRDSAGHYLTRQQP